MSARRSAVALGLAVASGIGVGVAVHESIELNVAIAHAQACISEEAQHPDQRGNPDLMNQDCIQTPHSQAEVQALQDGRGIYNWLGVFGAVGVVVGVVGAIDYIDSPDPTQNIRKTLIIKRDPPTDDTPPDAKPTEPDNPPAPQGFNSELSVVRTED